MQRFCEAASVKRWTPILPQGDSLIWQSTPISLCGFIFNHGNCLHVWIECDNTSTVGSTKTYCWASRSELANPHWTRSTSIPRLQHLGARRLRKTRHRQLARSGRSIELTMIASAIPKSRALRWIFTVLMACMVLLFHLVSAVFDDRAVDSPAGPLVDRFPSSAPQPPPGMNKGMARV